MNRDYPEIIELSKQLSNVRIHFGLTDLSRVYRLSDLAIFAAGITLYELASYGVPSIAYSMVDNQIHTAEAFDKIGISINIGASCQPQFFSNMFSAVHNLINNHLLRKRMSDRAIILIDGYGALRIADCIIEGKGKNV